MTWFKVDDKFHDHRKTRRALRVPGKRRDAAAIGLWGLAGSWCADNLTDGFVPADEISRWDDDAEQLAERLVDAELWTHETVDGEPGYRFVNWSAPGMQPTKEQVERKREQARDRMRAVRSAGGKGSGSRDVRANSEGTSRDVRSTPSRPVPTRPSAAAAAEADDAAAAADPDQLPTPVAILRDKLQAHTPLRALRFDGLHPSRLGQLEQLIDTHGDKTLVDVAIRTLRTPPPVHVTAFLGTWAALPAPGQRLAVVKAYCTEPGHEHTELRGDGSCPACLIAAKVGDR